MKWMRHLGFSITFLVAGTATAAAQLAGTAPDYSGFSASVCIPYSNPQSPPFTSPPMLRFSVENGDPMEVTMDTGSVGITMSSNLIPNYQELKTSPGAQPGQQFLSSSGLLRVGTWVPVTVTFFDGNTPLATAEVPVLGVEREGRCLNGSCQADQLPAVAPNMVYLGVGFGLDCKPDATPDKNPLLNLATIAGRTVAGAFNAGYIVGSTGVTVGLTPASTGGFAFVKLAPVSSCGDWTQAAMCVQINGSDCATGTLLVDTGIPQSYITVPFPVPTMPAPDPSIPGQQVGVLTPGTTVAVNIPGLPDPVAVDSFTIGQNTPVEPLVVIPSNADGAAFVNTGRHFLRQVQLLYDARNGYFGLKPQGNGCGG